MPRGEGRVSRQGTERPGPVALSPVTRPLPGGFEQSDDEMRFVIRMSLLSSTLETDSGRL